MPKLSRPFIYLFRQKLGNNLSNKLNKSILADAKSGNSKSVSKKENIKTFVRGLLDISPIFFSNETLKIIDHFKPDVIYTMGSTISVLKTARFLSKRYDSKIVLHFMDNWRETLYSNSKLMRPFKITLNRWIEKVENSNFSGLVISNKMAREYTKLSNKKYYTLMNCVQDVPYKNPTTNQNQTRIFTYTGGLHLNRWKELVLMEKCLRELKENGQQVKLYIYTSRNDKEKYSDLFNEDITVFKDYLPHNKVYLAYKEADILVHIESFEPDIVQFTKYSLSTKIPEYMSSGRPILCLAPSTLAVSEYINEVKAGIAVGNYNDLLCASKRLVNDIDYRVECGMNGIETVLRSHTVTKANDLLLQVFSD
ncbi:hypothetical protein LIS77_22920 [Cytobacillus firmus]|uniref:glycosyltransferase n=1 Tax=Cytobacillus firmus TaxID=1399 RepID=UPI002079AA7D|nr:glycosyltransferase [Cytobacillus firmus]USK38701.1 hypothetical protein LIS77_22920 [Cytobacillus firmus]